MADETLTLKQAAERVGVSPSTLKRWADAGVIPEVDGKGRWTDAAVAHARIVARLRDRGHRLDQIREASRQGRLAYGYIEAMFEETRATRTLEEASEETGLEPAMIQRFWSSIGLPPTALETPTDEDLEALRYVSSVLGAGFPLVAFLQLCRVYGQALSQIADAEVRLFHIYVHEPLMREGVPGLQMAEEMEGLARDLMPLAAPLMDYTHRRFLQHFVAQDVVGHMETELEEEDADQGRVRVAIAFADLAGYTRFTEEEGEEEALSSVERFVEGVTNTLPDDARVVKTIGDEVMVVEQRHPRAGRLGRRLQHPLRGAARAAHRRALRLDAVPRRRLLRPRGQPRLARGRARPRRRGARHGLGGRGGGRLGAPDLRGDRAGQAEGLRRAAPALPGDRQGGELSEPPLEAARASGLVRAGEPLLVLLSGGGDSVLPARRRLAARCATWRRCTSTTGCRKGAGEDEAFVRALCAGLGVPLLAERVELAGEGNLQERARDARYALAEQHADGDYAAAHTASDQAETVLYRLAVSPGSRALHGMAPRRGRLVRPLLGTTRDEVREYLRARGIEWREDPSNADRRFARARVRHDLLDALRTVGPAPERTIAETARRLREEAEVLDAVVSEALEALGGGPAIDLAALREHPPAVQRLVLRRMAGDRPVPDSILDLDDRGTRSIDLGDGLRAVSEYGTLRFTRAGQAALPDPVELAVPGRARFGDWEVEASLSGAGDVRVSGIGGSVTVRGWREGDRMRPAGLGGTKSLQDLFTDRKVPRALRRTLPVVESGGQIVWVAGVAVGEDFAVGADAPGAVALSAHARG